MPVPDPFPNELVEAAAREWWNRISHGERGSWSSLPLDVKDRYRKHADAVLAAVLPLIEQRVIDRLARGAKPQHCHTSYAAGVAAERARWEEIVTDLCDRQHDYPSDLSRNPREWARAFDRARAAIASERTTGEDA